MAQTEDWSQFPEAPAEDWSQFPEADAAPAPKAAQPGLVDRGLAVMKNVGAAMLDPMGKTQPSQSDRIVAGANEISATQPGRARIEELGAPVRPEVARKVRETPQATEPWQQNVQAAGRADQTLYFAKRFAAKEAIYKALSASGVEGLGWRDADIANNGRGAPVVTLTGACKTALERLTPDGYNPEISISLSDEPPHALAFVVLSVIGPKDQ